MNFLNLFRWPRRDATPTRTGALIQSPVARPEHAELLRDLRDRNRRMFRSYDAAMPYMLRLTEDGVAIHGSNVRQGYATHGCIGVPIDFAKLLFGAAKKGDPVVILPAQALAKKA